MLSYTDNESSKLVQTLVARVHGGNLNGEVLFLYDKEFRDDSEMDYDEIYNIIETNKQKNRLTNFDLSIMKEAMMSKHAYKPKHEYMKQEFLKAKKAIESNNKMIKIQDDGKFVPLMDLNRQRNVWSICGASGSGKSFLSSLLIREYMNIFPENEVYLFSGKKHDEQLDSLGITRIDINTELKDDITEKFRDCLVMFDDIDTILPVEIETQDAKGKTKKIKVNLTEKARSIRDKLLEIGRDIGVSMICLSHQLFNYKATRTQLLESHYVVFFNQGTGLNHIKRFINNYIGCEKKTVEKILALTSRWTLCSMQTMPKYILGENSCFTI